MSFPLHTHACMYRSVLGRTRQAGLVLSPSRTIPPHHSYPVTHGVPSSSRRCRSQLCQLPRKSRGRWIAQSTEDSVKADGRYPFSIEDFYEVVFVPKPYSVVKCREAGNQGVITFLKGDDGPYPASEVSEVFEVYVGGDVLEGMFKLLYKNDPEVPQIAANNRPLTHEFLWTILSQVQQQHSGTWSLLKAAIVGIEDNVYIGRAFFGDPATGEVCWDLDCRPSDACWMAFKSEVPMYIRRWLWDQDKKPFQSSYAYQVIQKPDVVTHRDEPLPEEVQLMIKQLEVAIKEEDYPKAISLRDHPYMKLYSGIKKAEEENHHLLALLRRDELKALVLKSRQQGGLSSD